MFDFIVWWWSKRDSGEKIFTAIAVWGLISLCSVPSIGINVIMLFLFGIVLCCLIYLVYRAYISIRNQIEKYRQERDYERQRIIDRLSGRQ